MARHIDPKCKLCRREGVKLYLKGYRCETAKCSITKKRACLGVNYQEGARSCLRMESILEKNKN